MCALMVGNFFADDWEQRRFAALRYGYYSMGQRQYEEAIDLFEQYLNVESDIYWYLMELVNGESYSCKNVSDCLEECKVLAYKLIFEYIETFYNTVRIHSHCGYLSSNEYEE